jgi:hypothetical protein
LSASDSDGDHSAWGGWTQPPYAWLGPHKHDFCSHAFSLCASLHKHHLSPAHALCMCVFVSALCDTSDRTLWYDRQFLTSSAQHHSARTHDAVCLAPANANGCRPWHVYKNHSFTLLAHTPILVSLPAPHSHHIHCRTTTSTTSATRRIIRSTPTPATVGRGSTTAPTSECSGASPARCSRGQGVGARVDDS